MQVPIHITFRNTPPSDVAEAFIRERGARLEKFSDRITALAVVVECPKRERGGDPLFRVRLHISMPGKEIVVGRKQDRNEAHRDIYVAIRDAFDVAVRQLQDYARTSRGDIKRHSA